ncbi:trypco2 family protein [Streptomyces sp. IB201691-2A2]|uniref:trypco2 family protein n=1 Tax=Streptomyces sp. IB201691-2A2 TaxID=2561920 RepID=UPI001CA63388
MTPETDLDLEEAVVAVRDSLLRAAMRAGTQPLRFEVGPIEMDFTVELRRETTGDFGIKAFVIGAGGKRASARTDTHHVHLVLTPQLPDGSKFCISTPDNGAAGKVDLSSVDGR